jgi:pheromone shutdown protein TraB
MIKKLILSTFLLISPMAHAVGEEQQIQALKSMASPQQIDMILQKFQPQMKPEQRAKLLSNIVQQQINNLSPQEAAQLANARMIDMPNLVQKHISNMPPAELKQIKQSLQLQKPPKQ